MHHDRAIKRFVDMLFANSRGPPAALKGGFMHPSISNRFEIEL